MKNGFAIWCVVMLATCLGACGGDDDGPNDSPQEAASATSGPDGGSDTVGATGATVTQDFDECIASVKQTCELSELDTAEKIETACFDLTFLAIPLEDGSTYGPVTLKGGPYGGKTEWNEGAGTDFVNPVNMNEPRCLPAGIDSFMEPDEVTADLKNVRDIDYSLYTIFRPACMKEGEKYPVITWANGTCGLTHGYGPLLTGLASRGFVVIASNSTWTNTAPTNGVQVRAIDYAEFINEDPDSIFYHKLDLDRIGAMGHSQGSAATAATAKDDRVKAIIMWNGGPSNLKPFLFVSGERDINDMGPERLETATDNATQPGAWVYHHKVLETGGKATGHLVLMEQPERVIDLAVAWWRYTLLDDPEAKKMFVGSDCGLCNMDEDFEYGHNELLE